MFWLYVIGAVLVVWFATRRVLKRRSAPKLDQQHLENANYMRIQSDVHSLARRWEQGGGGT
jgi:hypothetical protein